MREVDRVGNKRSRAVQKIAEVAREDYSFYSFPRSCVGMQTVAEPSTDMGSHAGAWEPGELSEIVRLIACLGGYLGRMHNGPPGAKVMWVGLQRLRDFVIALEVREALAGRCA
jgi:hypothetical protein